MAAGALRALRDAGRRVPDDVAVVGFDDAPIASHTLPTLTTVRQPVEEMTAAAAALLLRRVGDALGEGRARRVPDDARPARVRLERAAGRGRGRHGRLALAGGRPREVLLDEEQVAVGALERR